MRNRLKRIKRILLVILIIFFLVQCVLAYCREKPVTDTIVCSNLYSRKEYQVRCVLMDDLTGKPILVDDKQVTAKENFMVKPPYETTKKIKIVYPVKSSEVKNTIPLSFITLYQDGKELGSSYEGRGVNKPSSGNLVVIEGREIQIPVDE